MAYVILIPIAWAAGVAAYVLASLLFFGQWVSSGDLQAVLISSAVAFAVCVAVLNYPLLYALRAKQGNCERLAPFVLASAPLGIFPTAVVLFYFGGNLTELASPQAFLFLCLFGVAGTVLGLGFAYVSNWSA